MTLLETPKSDYLLESSLEGLHDESREWLSDLEFIHEEIMFYYTLLRSAGRRGFPDRGLAELEKNLVSLNGEQIGPLLLKTQHHEHSLATFFRRDPVLREQDEEAYRRGHGAIQTAIGRLEHRLRDFKSRLFSYARTHNLLTV